MLRAMHRHLEAAFARGGQAVAQQFGAAGIDLHGRDHAAEPSRRVALSGIDGLERRRKVAPALREVPLVIEAMAGRHDPPGVAIHRRCHRADAGAGQHVEPAVPCHGKIGHGGAAALQQLGDRILGRGLVGLELCGRAARLLGQARRHEHRLLVEDAGHVERRIAQLLDQPAAEALGLQMRVDVHHSRHDAQPASIDPTVGRPGIARIDVDQPVAVEHDIDVVAEIVLPRGGVPRDHPARIPDAGDGHRRPRSFQAGQRYSVSNDRNRRFAPTRLCTIACDPIRRFHAICFFPEQLMNFMRTHEEWPPMQQEQHPMRFLMRTCFFNRALREASRNSRGSASDLAEATFQAIPREEAYIRRSARPRGARRSCRSIRARRSGRAPRS